MKSKYLIIILLISFQLSFSGYHTFAQIKLDEVFIQSQSNVLLSWLDDTELSKIFELIRVRLGRHPDDSINRKVYRLELRMLPQGPNMNFDIAYFRKFSETFYQTNQISLHEKLFFKFVHLFHLSPKNASIHIHIYDTDISSYLSENSSLVTDTSRVRMERSSMVIDDTKLNFVPVKLTGWTSTKIKIPSTVDAEKLIRFFKAYYAKKGAAKLQFVPYEEDYVGFSVENIKNEIISDAKLWEKFQISLYFHHKQAEFKFRCHLDGQYAPGMGTSPPMSESYRDMEPKYSRHLVTYADNLLFNLKKYLVEGE